MTFIVYYKNITPFTLGSPIDFRSCTNPIVFPLSWSHTILLYQCRYLHVSCYMQYITRHIPHINCTYQAHNKFVLQGLTHLFEGSIFHRDSILNYKSNGQLKFVCQLIARLWSLCVFSQSYYNNMLYSWFFIKNNPSPTIFCNITNIIPHFKAIKNVNITS